MRVIESVLLAILIAVSATASISDLKKGSIPNKLIVMGLVGGAVLDSIYYFGFEQPLALRFLINLTIVLCISILLYGFHIWSAGDSKLTVLLTALIPARMYAGAVGNVAPCVAIFIFIFSIGFLYVIVESIFLGIKRKDLFKTRGIRFKLKDFMLRFVAVSAILFFLTLTITAVFPAFYEKNHLLFLFINLFIILLIQDWKLLTNPIAAGAFVLISAATAILSKTQYVVNWYIYIVVALVILLRTFAEKYNYETIQTADVKAGMILSLGTTLRFQKSKVSDLPHFTTEDLRTKLTDNEVEAILRWKETKNGDETLVIVRKLPFAVIISGSTALFVLTEVLLK